MLAKIDISAMTSVVRGVERSVGDLTADRGSLRNILAGVQVDTAPAARFDAVLAWAETPTGSGWYRCPVASSPSSRCRRRPTACSRS